MEIDKFKKNISTLMDKSITLLIFNFNTLRTNKITPDILNKIYIIYNGKKTYIKNLSNIYVENSHTLRINLWDNTIINEIKKAILKCLDVNPIINKHNIKLILSPLTAETRKSYIIKARAFAENSKIYLRNTRRNIKKDINNKLKLKIYNLDQAKTLDVILQQLTDNYIHIINKLLQKKEKDLLKI